MIRITAARARPQILLLARSREPLPLITVSICRRDVLTTAEQSEMSKPSNLMALDKHLRRTRRGVGGEGRQANPPAVTARSVCQRAGKSLSANAAAGAGLPQ
jgi:hypothetical protein